MRPILIFIISMRRFGHIVLLLTLALSWCLTTYAQQQQQPKKLPDVTSTEGREFFVAWLPNGGSVPSDMDLKLYLIASSRNSNTIVVETPDGSITPYPCAANSFVQITVDPQTVYWDASQDEEEKLLSKGIRVYSLNDERFTLYSINQNGVTGTYSFDGAHILPVEALGNEYMIETAAADEIATEFVIMSTKPGLTNVNIELKANSRRGNTQQLSVTLNGPKQIYIVRSKSPVPEDPNDFIDLSGSTVCADQTIAVWSGNQLASVPNQDAMSKDHAYDQLLPVNKWGKTFLIPLTGLYTQYNEIHVTALHDNTTLTVASRRGTTTYPLSATDDSTFVVKAPLGGNQDNNTHYITADKPVQVYMFTSAGAANPYDDDNEKRHLQGDPSMTIIPPLEYLTDTTIFTTYDGGDGGLTHEMRLWARTSDVNGIRLDGNTISGSFSAVSFAPGYSQAKISLQHGKHIITAPKKCFSGYVYGMNDGQTYIYPVGYDFTPQQDSLFLLDNYAQYTVRESEWKNKAVSPTEGGWYLNRVLQDDGEYLLDSIFVCDSTMLNFPIKTYNAWSKVRWEIEGSIQGKGYYEPTEQSAELVARPQLDHQFHLLPIEENDEPYEDFEVRGILIHAPIFCEIPEDKWERDTFNTIVRVMRSYNDTTWRSICQGDTVQFFKDTVWKVNPATISGKPVAGRDFVLQVTIFNDTLNNPSKGYYQYPLGPTTITKHYISSGGCDSLSTLKLFVCSPHFEHKDTTICQDGMRGLNYGDFFKKYKGTTNWPKGDNILSDTLRAKGCMSTAEYQEFKKHCPDFNGCDSVLELHLVNMAVINNTTVENVCMSQLAGMGGTYKWYEKESGRLLGEFKPDTMTLDSAYTFRKNFKYIDCTDCPRGGCDSVRNTLRLTFVSDAGQAHTMHVCQGQTYTYANMTARYTFDSRGKLCNTPYTYDLNVQVYGIVDGRTVVLCEFIDQLTFYVDTVYHDQMTYDTVCIDPVAVMQHTQTYNWVNHPKYAAIPINGPGYFTYVDTLKTAKCGDGGNCDSICVLRLRVASPQTTPTAKVICDDEAFTWQDTLFYGINYKGTKPALSKLITDHLYTSRKDTVTQYGCDSILTFRLTVWPTFVAERKDTFVCANEPYDFYGTLYNTPSNPWTPGQTYPLEIHDQSVHGCDSAVLHYVTVYPVYLNEREPNDTVCQVLTGEAYYVWEGADHAAWNAQQLRSLRTAGTFELTDHLFTTQGCDSIIHRTLVILPTYDLPFTHMMSSEDTLHWEGRIYAGNKAVFDNPDGLPVIVCTGEKTITDSLYTKTVGTHFCDSVRTLRLKIGQIFRDTMYDATCANCAPYRWVITSPITGQDTTIYITDLPTAYQERFYYDSLKTSLDYDSIYVLRLTGYPNYEYQAGGELCQGQTYNWVGHDPVPSSMHGIMTVVDSLHTDTIYTNPKTGQVKPMHCDSVWTLTLVVHPTYNDRYVELTDYRSMASNDTISHFTSPHTLFIGYSFDYEAAGVTKAELEQRYERVVYIPSSHALMHRDSVVNTSAFGCDSVHYVEIAICEVKFTQVIDTIADNDSIWSFGGETEGRQHTLPLVTGHKFHYYDDGTPVDYTVAEGRTMRQYLFIDTLRTEFGCDSIVHDSVFVFPSYRFQFDTAVCSNTRYDWRRYTNLNQGHTGFVYDSVNYHVGTHTFDSVYALWLDVMPSGYWQYDTTLCMNDTILWHYQKVYYRPGGLTWVEAEYKDESTPCGEIHHMDLTFMPFYGSTLVEYDTICQGDPGESYQWISDERVHTQALRDADGKPITSIPADILGEFVYYDSLKTVSCGCDSTYTLHLVIKPAYRFYTDTAICTRDTFVWIVKDKDGQDYTNGKQYVSEGMTHLYDTIFGATPFGCDSTYFLHVFVDQPYDLYTDTVLCAADGHFEWNDVIYDDLITDSHNWTEPREFYDTIRAHTAAAGCDSTMYLHLTIAPSADSVWTDTICVGETYTIMGHEYTEGGLHTFSTTNAWGCEVVYKLTLVAIEPTRVTLTPEPVCTGEAGQDLTYTVRYSYQGRFAPTSYSVRYDSAALEAGFEDLEDIALPAMLKADKEYEIYLPTPRLEAKENYPRPDHYHATIAFENDVCMSDSLMTFPLEITLNYPSWLMEQRHGDVIALLNEQYNGGYTWTEYQWYEGTTKLIGQTKPYLHIATGLTPGATYHVELLRPEENEAFPTCEIVAVANPVYNDFEPTMGYLGVTPTCVVTGHPFVSILSRKDGTYRVATVEGHLVTEGTFHADVTPVELPAVTGMYIIQLWSPDTQNEPYRAIKVFVREQCPNCDISSF